MAMGEANDPLVTPRPHGKAWIRGPPMIIVTPEAAEVKPADVFPLAFRDAYQEIEADARDLADEMSDADREAAEDAYWAAMDEATLERMAGESRYADLVDSGLMPW